MSDVCCPYCDYGQYIDHEDGYGYQEDELYTQTCINCDKEFDYYTSINYYYTVLCSNGKHKFKPIKGYTHITKKCERCGYLE